MQRGSAAPPHAVLAAPPAGQIEEVVGAARIVSRLAHAGIERPRELRLNHVRDRIDAERDLPRRSPRGRWTSRAPDGPADRRAADAPC